MIRRRPFLAALALAGCGGGGAPGLPVVAVYGDSIASGHIAVPPGRLAVPPARRLQELLAGRATVADFAQPGARVRDALTGAATMPLGPFAEHVRAARPDVVVLRFGGADVVLGTPVSEFARDLALLVDHAHAAGARVVLVGMPHSAEQWESRAVIFDAAILVVVGWKGVAFVDTFSLAAGGLADGIHPDAAYADRLTAPIAASIAERE